MSSTSFDPTALPPLSASRRRASGGFTVTLLPALPYEVNYVSDHHTVGFTFERQEGLHSFASDRRRPFYADSWCLAWTPAGCEVFSASNKGGEYLVLSVAPETFARLTPSIARGQLPQTTNVAAPCFTPLAMAMRRAVCSGVFMDGLAIETVATAAVERLAMQISGQAEVPGIAAGMTPWRIKRILDYLDAYLETDVHLADLARHVGLSEGYLARAFKATTGTTLHAALVERRIARARQLMGAAVRHQTEIKLAAVAAESGFSSHAHMTTAFRRVLGITPSQYYLDGKYLRSGGG